ncbi:MAG: bifunctional folylpolyglutamate synthase/dihydrofolate synthase [Gemmatimonadetes bacterium]|nr:bifunctional folylpolyglutamate synthase/dihydrofolate synthase [Gemmatimonadota bacterium]
MTLLSYQQLIRELFPRLTGGIQWGLERTHHLMAAVGNPHRAYRVLHVGGTNGKGSVAATLAAVLQRAGVRTGLYTSPHLCAFRERVQVQGAPLDAAALVAAAERLWPSIQQERASFFEATTAIAFLALAEAGVETAVIEVGLGGRLDSTNVVAPEVVALTNVALDHAQYLGPTIEAVAREKAGIIKAGVPAVTTEADPALREVFRRRADEVGASLHVLEAQEAADVRFGRDGTRFRLATGAWGSLELHTPLIGKHQATNAALAVRTLEQLPEAWRPDRCALLDGVRQVHWPGRLQIERIGGLDWVFDVAHNPAGMAATVSALEQLVEQLVVARPLVALVGILGDKDWHGMLRPLAGLADRLILTIPPTAPAERLWEPERVRRELELPRAEVVREFGAALERVAILALGGGRPGGAAGTVLVTGSSHTVGDAMAALGRAPWGADPGLPGCASPV